MPIENKIGPFPSRLLHVFVNDIEIPVSIGTLSKFVTEVKTFRFESYANPNLLELGSTVRVVIEGEELMAGHVVGVDTEFEMEDLMVSHVIVQTTRAHEDLDDAITDLETNPNK